MLFIILLAFTTFCIAASAAFFSVFGMMQTYSAIAIPILIMGASLELGKLMTASVLYRMWGKLKSLKYYLMVALFGLMLMTSLGIFGYLTSGYQKDSIPMEQITQKLQTDKQEIDRLIARKAEIDQQIAKLPANFVTGRQKLMTSFETELKNISPRIDALQKEIGEYQTKKIDTEGHIGPIIYVAKIFNRSPDEAVFWFTLLIMLVFDPLAIALTLATNMAIKHRQESLVVTDPPVIAPEPTPAPTATPEPTAEPTYGPPPAKLVEDQKVFREAMAELVEKEKSLTKDDVVDIVKSAIETEDLQANKTRQAILTELRK